MAGISNNAGMALAPYRASAINAPARSHSRASNQKRREEMKTSGNTLRRYDGVKYRRKYGGENAAMAAREI